MTKIEHTNLIVDNFSIAKRETQRVYTHLLSHVHTDHLKGLYDGWNYGPIYCTRQTGRLLMHKYPSLTCIREVEYRRPTVIKMSETLEVTVTFLDANHMAGSALILIETYIGTILYTGDIRFNKSLFKTYHELYPAELLNDSFTRCSKQIDILYLDNTFLKKKFNFPPKEEALSMLLNHIKELLEINQHSRIYIALDSVGKEEAAVEIAQYFEIDIVVDEQRYEQIQAMDFDAELFTTNYEEGFIEIIRKDKLYKKLKENPQATGIILSGWVNNPTYRFNKRIYCIPYSLHSNYQQIHEFVASIAPTHLYPIVDSYPDQNKLYYAEKTYVNRHDLLFNQEMFEEGTGGYHDQIQELRKRYCTAPTEEYSRLMGNIEILKKIQEELQPPKQIQLSNQEKCVVPAGMQTVARKKYKIKSEGRNQQEFNRLRNQILMKKKMHEGEEIHMISDSEEATPVDIRVEDKWLDLDERQEVQIQEDEIVEVDPFELARNKAKIAKIKAMSFQINQKKEEDLRRSQSEVIERGQPGKMTRIEKWLKLGRQSQKHAYISVEQESNEAVQEERRPSEEEIRPVEKERRIVQLERRPELILSELTEINLSNLDNIKIFKKSSDAKEYTSNNQNSMSMLMKYIKSRSKRAK